MNEQKEACYKRIRQAMELRGIKAVDLVQATGLGKSAISQYISSKVVSKEETELLDMYHKLDALDKKELFKWIAYRLTDEKYDVKKEPNAV